MTRLVWSNDGSDRPDSATERPRLPENADAPGLGWRAIRAGTKAPDFRLADQHGRCVTLDELLPRGAVVVRFCRNENTAICIREFNSLSALHHDMKRLGAELMVIAVEPFDPRPLGKEVAAFPFPILPDKTGEVARSYGLTCQVSEPSDPEISDANTNSGGSGTMSAPATFVIDPTGLVALAFVDVECRSLMDHGQILKALECLARRNSL